ncbi:energy transducer TonB [Sphingomonas sp. OTU376]|uniref:energy transducer TonB n=1 Tax=Sphingomonas sp. OTU376 TaxID=3043863 RepID=UPI00313B54F1
MPLNRHSIRILFAIGTAAAPAVPAAAQAVPPRTTGDDRKPGGFVTVPTRAPEPFKPAPLPARPAVPPRLLTAIVGPDDYPAALIAAGAQGRIVVTIQISASGEPTACEIRQSTGFPALDSHTCGLVMQRARFEPARNEQGDPVRSYVLAPITWQIPTE